MEIQKEIIMRSVLMAQVEKANHLSDEMAHQFWPMIGTANQCAYAAMDEAVEAMKECGMFRQQVKAKAQRAMLEFEKYEAAAHKHFDALGNNTWGLWQDLVCRASDKLQPDIQKLYFAIKNVIDKYGVKNSYALAKIQTALALVTMSTLMYDTMVEQFQRQTPISLKQTFSAGRLTASESCWRMVGYITGNQTLRDIDLAHDEACALGVRVLLAKYQSADFLNDAAGEALRLNPDVITD